MESIFGRQVSERKTHFGHVILARGQWKPMWQWVVEALLAIALLVGAILVPCVIEQPENVGETIIMSGISTLMAVASAVVYYRAL